MNKKEFIRETSKKSRMKKSHVNKTLKAAEKVLSKELEKKLSVYLVNYVIPAVVALLLGLAIWHWLL